MDKAFEEFEIIRGSIAWPYENLPGSILIGGLLRGTEGIKILHELRFKTLSEAKKVIIDHKVKFLKTLNYVYCQNTPESEGFLKYLRGQYSDPYFKPAPYIESIDYSIQLVSSYLDDNKLIVPKEGLLATQLQTGWENISPEKSLRGVIALACLIAGIQARFEGFFSEDCIFQDFPDR